MSDKPVKKVKASRKKRVGIRQSVRFEVFKRDKFTCQYCGAKAPDVVLNVDHIEPVSKGGGNNILNLITACVPCNGGKSDRVLSSADSLAKARQQMEELEERRQQIQMMAKWHKSLVQMKALEADVIAQHFTTLTGFTLNANGIAGISRLLKTFGLDEILPALNDAVVWYCKQGPDKTSVELALQKLGGVCRVNRSKQDEPYIVDLYYCRGILKNRFGRAPDDCIERMKLAYKTGVSLDLMQKLCKHSQDYEDFFLLLEAAPVDTEVPE